MREEFKEKHILDSRNLMKIRKAKTRDEMIRCMVAASKAGYKYEMIGLAAGISRQRAHQIIKKHLETMKKAGTVLFQRIRTACLTDMLIWLIAMRPIRYSVDPFWYSVDPIWYSVDPFWYKSFVSAFSAVLGR